MSANLDLQIYESGGGITVELTVNSMSIAYAHIPANEMQRIVTNAIKSNKQQIGLLVQYGE